MKIRKSARMDRIKARGKYRPTLERLEKREVFATLSGVVFHDLNGDGVRAADEPGLAGWTVFQENDRNNVLDPADLSTQSDASGAYSFIVPDSPYFSFLGIQKPQSSTFEEWTPTTDSYKLMNYNPAGVPQTVFNFGMRLNNLGDLTRVGNERLVNPDPEGTQGSINDGFLGEGDILDSDDVGNYVVGWAQFGAVPVAGQYTHSAFIRVYNADGTPRTGAIPLGTFTSTNSSFAPEPYVAFSGDGTRIVTSWIDQIRVFGSNGQLIAGPIVANPVAKNEGYGVRALDIDHNGDFVAVSTGYKSGWLGNNEGITVFQRYNANGAKVGNRVQVVDAALINGVQDVAMDAAGNFLVTWTDSGLNGQRYSASGAKIGSPIKFATKAASNVSLSMLPNGQFALAWLERETVNGVRSEKVFARRFQANGTPISAPILISDHNLQNDIALDADGTMRIVWSDNARWTTSTTGKNNAINMMMRSVSPTGVLSDRVVVNTTWEGRQANAHVTPLQNGKLIVAWAGRGIGDDRGIFTQRFELTSQMSPARALTGVSEANKLDADSLDTVDLIYAQLLEEELDPKGRNKRSLNLRA